jgi:hypothetical protein
MPKRFESKRTSNLVLLVVLAIAVCLGVGSSESKKRSSHPLDFERHHVDVQPTFSTPPPPPTRRPLASSPELRQDSERQRNGSGANSSPSNPWAPSRSSSLR